MIEFTVNDMTCGHCASRVTQAVKSVDDQAKVTIDVANKTVRIEGAGDIDAIAAALTEAGYPPTPTRSP